MVCVVRFNAFLRSKTQRRHTVCIFYDIKSLWGSLLLTLPVTKHCYDNGSLGVASQAYGMDALFH